MLNRAGVTYRIDHISPAVATTMLENARSSTKPNTANLRAFASDMNAGRWIVNGAPIIVSSGGKLLDGRVRLRACIEANVSFETVIVEGIDASAFETIDTLRKRTLADILTLRGEKHGTALAAGLRILQVYSAGGAPGTDRSPGPTTLLRLLEDHPDIRDSVMPALNAVPLIPHGAASRFTTWPAR